VRSRQRYGGMVRGRVRCLIAEPLVAPEAERMGGFVNENETDPPRDESGVAGHPGNPVRW
jgi:hypothetical protein